MPDGSRAPRQYFANLASINAMMSGQAGNGALPVNRGPWLSDGQFVDTPGPVQRAPNSGLLPPVPGIPGAMRFNEPLRLRLAGVNDALPAARAALDARIDAVEQGRPLAERRWWWSRATEVPKS